MNLNGPTSSLIAFLEVTQQLELVLAHWRDLNNLCLSNANCVNYLKCPYQIVILLKSVGQNKPVYIGSDDEIISTIEHIQIIQNIDLSIVFMGNILFYHRADHEMLESLYPNYLVTKW